MPDLPQNIVFLDVETTGFSSKNNEIIQIAAIKTLNGEIIDSFNTFIQIENEIPTHITELTGITNSDCNEGMNLGSAITKLYKFVDDSYICAHNSRFDYSFLHEAGLVTDYNDFWIDTLDLARISYPLELEYSLESLSKTLNINKPAHNAIDDCLTCKELYFKCVDKLKSLDISVLKTILVLARKFDLTLMMPIEMALGQLDSKAISEIEKFSILSQKSLKDLRQKNIASIQSKFNENEKKKERLTFDSFDMFGTGDCEVLKYPSNEEIEEFFKKDGLLNNVFDNYELREGQLQFSKAIRDSFMEDSILVTEAETGIGKTMSYLIVAILFSQLNGLPVGVSSNTNTLIDQLINKDLPSIDRLFKHPLKYTSLKGISHYICMRKFSNLLKQYETGQKINTDKEKQTITSILILLTFISETVYDDIDNLSINFGGLYKNQYSCESNECFKTRCPFYKKCCYTHGNREIAQKANIVVTNHSLSFNNCAADGAILPKIDRWIVDEAHNCEEWARHAFTHEISTNLLKSIAEKSTDVSKSKSVINKVISEFSGKHNSTLFYALAKKLSSVGVDLAYKAGSLADTMVGLSTLLPRNSVVYETEEIWISAEKFRSKGFSDFICEAKSFIEIGKKQYRQLVDMLSFLDDYTDVSSASAEIQNYKNDIKEALSSLSAIVKENKNTHVVSVTIPKKESNLPYSVTAKPLDISRAIHKTFLNECKSIVFTSATLSIDKSFDIFKKALGINLQVEEGREVRENIIKSPFDFDDNMSILTIGDLPEPVTKSSPKYMSYIYQMADFLYDCHVANGGSCLTLFASMADMRACYEIVAPKLNEKGLQTFSQTNGVSRHYLISQFKENENASLFAVKSFWEGIDAPGDTLRCVIIVKLPFTNVSDPLYRKLDEIPNINCFTDYSLPRAIIQTKQACGRLIRQKDDSGFVIIADSRIEHRSYGRLFVNSFQSKNVRKTNAEDAISIIRHH